MPGTTPDILPGFWGVYLEPSDGETFVGLITRGDGSWESITQRLKGTVRPGECYNFTLDLAHSPTYAGYNQPLRLRIWGGSRKCQTDQLLFESDFIESEEWETFAVQFTAKQEINYLVFEAFFQEKPAPHLGNILIDNISSLKRCVRALANRGD